MSTLLSIINKMDEEFKKNRENSNNTNNISTNNTNDINNINSATTPKTTKSTKTAKNGKNTKTTKKSQPKQVQTKVQQKTEPIKSTVSTTNLQTPTITKKDMTKTQTVTLTTQDYIESIFRLIYYICNNKEGYGLTTTKITFSVLNGEISSITGIPEGFKPNTDNPQDTIAKDNKTGVCADVSGKTGIFNFAYNDENKLAMREFYKYCKDKLIKEGVDKTLLEGSFAIDLDVLFELFKRQG